MIQVRGTSAQQLAEKARGFSTVSPFSAQQMASWQAQLDAIVPRTDKLSWLKLAWEPGYAWERIDRLVIWQMVPPTRRVQKFDASGELHWVDELNMPHEVWDALNGPSPMADGHACFDGWCDCEPKKKRWVGGSAVPGVDLMAWTLFQETKCYGKRWWVIQGENGGHRVALNSKEQRIARFAMNGKDPKVPPMGGLPFAPFDQRVLKHLRAQDKLWAWQKTRGKDFASRNAFDVQADHDALALEGAQLLMAHLKDQTDFWLNEHAAPWLKAVNQGADWTQDPTPLDEEAVTKQFLTTATGIPQV